MCLSNVKLRRGWGGTILLLLLFMGSCFKGDIKPPVFNENNAMYLLKRLVAFGNRPSGSEANLRQAEYIAGTAEEYGANVVRQKFKQNTELGNLQFFNVEATIPGRKSDFIIIGSHFDTKKLPPNVKFEGANDGASSTAVLLEMIRTIMKSNIVPEYTLKFVFFDGEECITEYGDNDGLFGSKYYAGKLKESGNIEKCRAVIVLDMVGDKDLNITIPSDSDKYLSEALFKAAEECGTRKYFSYFRSPILDDHMPFKDLGIPVIDLIDFNFGPGNSFWHTSQDCVSNVSEKSLKIVGKTTLKMLFALNPAKNR